MGTKRRTGRTTILLLEAVAEFYRTGNVTLVDHPRDDGKPRNKMEYENLADKFRDILKTVMNCGDYGINKNIMFNVLPNGKGLTVSWRPDRMALKALKTIGEK